MTSNPRTRPTGAVTDLHPDLTVGLADDVAEAARMVAPLWPLTNFAAVDPLMGLQDMSFEDATALVRRWRGARTHETLASFREAHRAGRIGERVLRAAIAETYPELLSLQGVEVGSTRLDPVDVVRLDLLHGPELPAAAPYPTAAMRGPAGLSDATCEVIDDLICRAAASYVGDAGAVRRPSGDASGFWTSWQAHAAHDRRVRRLVGPAGRRWIAELGANPLGALAAALEHLAVPRRNRVDELRAQVARIPGWVGHARWAAAWDPDPGSWPRLDLVDLLAVRMVLEAAARQSPVAPPRTRPAAVLTHDDDHLDARVAAVLDGLPSRAIWIALRVRQVLEHVPAGGREAIWLAAREWQLRDDVLGRLVAPGTPPMTSPRAQLAFCIDVRSEGMRRHLEQAGPYETLGFAGFFGVPVRWRDLGSRFAEVRTPVFLTPTHEVTEHPVEERDGEAQIRRTRMGAAALSALGAAKVGAASPFVLAEAAGWLMGPAAGARTLVPRLTARATLRRRPLTRVALGGDGAASTGLDLATRVELGRSILAGMGLTDGFAPLVVFCGHRSATINNLHASSLDCGACGGTPGGASARVAAAILNDHEVRSRLASGGIEIPASTLFLAAEHETVTDQVEVLDRDAVPASHEDAVVALEADLDRAGTAHAVERAPTLPGSVRGVRHRGADWAEVRPEWGLAGNASFVIGPRSVTVDTDLGRRSFLHSYDAEADVDGSLLESIFAGPLRIVQWISAQYYFSTVDNDAFGAGDKMVHNPVGGLGVVAGEGGDLRAGLPLQSIHDGTAPVHEPVRMLVVVEAPLTRIESVLARLEPVRQLVEGGWLTLAARSDATDRWQVRSRSGTWTTWWPIDDEVACHTARRTRMPRRLLEPTAR